MEKDKKGPGGLFDNNGFVHQILKETILNNPQSDMFAPPTNGEVLKALMGPPAGLSEGTRAPLGDLSISKAFLVGSKRQLPLFTPEQAPVAADDLIVTYVGSASLSLLSRKK